MMSFLGTKMVSTFKEHKNFLETMKVFTIKEHKNKTLMIVTTCEMSVIYKK